MTRVYLDAIGFAAPSVPDWPALGALFDAGEVPDLDAGWIVAPACLDSRSARRLSLSIRLALLVTEQIADALPPTAAWIFASAQGEGETLGVILNALCEPEIMLQPLRFQNAVHNAAAGQWSIAHRITAPITSVAAYDHSFGAGLLKAAVQCAKEGRPVGVTVYDAPLPPPLHDVRPIRCPVGAALAISPERGPNSRFALTIAAADRPAGAPATAAGRTLWDSANPAARCIPLLEALHRGASGEVAVSQHGGPQIVVGFEELSGA